MGTYYTSRIGCYLEIPKSKEAVTHKVYKNKLGQTVPSKFNPETGEQHSEETITKYKTLHTSTYINDRDDLHDYTFFKPEYLGGPDKEIFIPNDNSDNLIKNENEYSFVQELSHIDPEEELIKFNIKYRDYIEAYQKKYPSLQVKFGIMKFGA